MALEEVAISAEDFFPSVVEKWSLDYRTIPAGEDKLEINRFFVKYFWYVPDTPLEFVKVDGKYVYRANLEQRIPVQILNDVTVVSLDNTIFKLPWAYFSLI